MALRNVKRYSNRKLYDSGTKRYVTLGELGQAIREGDEVRVLDYATQKNITAKVLAQVVVNELDDGVVGEDEVIRQLVQMIRYLVQVSAPKAA